MGQAVGFIETVGLTAAMEAADAAVKSANVRMIGYELTRGGGMVTVKVEGDVGAVKSAIDAARAASSKVNEVYSVHVIPRPALSTHAVIRTAETVLQENGAPDAGLPPTVPDAHEETLAPVALSYAEAQTALSDDADAPEAQSAPSAQDGAPEAQTPPPAQEETPETEPAPPSAEGGQELPPSDADDGQDSDEPAIEEQGGDGDIPDGDRPQRHGGPRRKRRRG